MKLLVFDGAFDPPHNGHLQIGLHARDALGFDRIVYTLRGGGRAARGVASTAQRLAMVREMVATYPGLDVSSAGLESDGEDQPRRTLSKLRSTRYADEIYLLRGLDELAAMDCSLFGDADFKLLIVARPGYDYCEHLRRNPRLFQFSDRLEYVACLSLSVSSTEVRRAVTAGRCLSSLVPPGVRRQIERIGAYR